MRELVWMGRGRRRQQWTLLSQILAQQANIYRGKKPPLSPEEMNPYSEHRKTRPDMKVSNKEWIHALARGLGAKGVPEPDHIVLRKE